MAQKVAVEVRSDQQNGAVSGDHDSAGVRARPESVVGYEGNMIAVF